MGDLKTDTASIWISFVLLTCVDLRKARIKWFLQAREYKSCTTPKDRLATMKRSSRQFVAADVNAHFDPPVSPMYIWVNWQLQMGKTLSETKAISDLTSIILWFHLSTDVIWSHHPGVRSPLLSMFTVASDATGCSQPAVAHVSCNENPVRPHCTGDWTQVVH